VPRILKHAPTDAVIKLSLDQPVSVSHIVLSLALSDLFLGRRELGTAADADSAWNFPLRKEHFKGFLVVSSSVNSLSVFALLLQRLDLVGTPKGPCATDINIAFLLEIGVRVNEEDVVR
jgi:hypothetical protein